MLNSSHVAALTNHQIFRGTIVTGTQRLSDTLNDSMSTYVEMEDVRVHTVTSPNTPTHALETLYIKKKHLLIVAILAEEINNPPGRLFSYVEKVQRSTVLFVRGFQIDGTMFFASREGGYTPVVGENEQFMPITDATIRSVINPNVRIRASTALVSTTALDGYHHRKKE